MSATGNSRPFRRHRRESGFTLMELMVVLVIVGLTSAAVMLAMPDPRGELREDALRLAARVRAAQDGAILDGRPVRLSVTPDGYRFEERVRGRWVVPGEGTLAPQSWGREVTVRISGGEGRILFDPTGTVEPMALTLARDEERATVRIEADGAVHVG